VKFANRYSDEQEQRRFEPHLLKRMTEKLSARSHKSIAPPRPLPLRAVVKVTKYLCM